MTEQRDVVVAGAVQRHQMCKYLSVLGVEWVADESLPGDKVRLSFTATGEQWSDIQAWWKRVAG